MLQINVNRAEKCVICENWYDPANAALSPKSPSIGLWEYEMKEKRMCKLKNCEMKACAVCNKFQRKMI